MRRVAGALLVLVLALHVVAVVQRADREPVPDEKEYLHAAWLMSKGERLYASFFEHHPPFLFGALELVATDDVPRFFVRARLFSGFFSVIALCALAAIVWRVQPSAAPLAIAFLLASLPLWMIGLAAARAEPFALAFFWTGVALVFLPRGSERFVSIAGGAGAACIAIAALWNPKWPLSSLAIAAFWMARMPRRFLSTAVAAAVTLAALLVLRAFATFDQLWFFVVDFNRANYPSVGRIREHWGEQSALTFMPLLLRPLAVAAALVLAGVAMKRLREKSIVLALMLLVCASALELRFFFPYPVLWHQYFLMWSFAGAALIALIPAALEALVPGRRAIAAIAFAALAVVVLANLIALAPLGAHGDDGPYWTHQRWLAQRLQPGERVLLDITHHPVAVRDATYYWFEATPVITDLRRTPRGARYLPAPEELPFCAMTTGAQARFRFVSEPRLLGASPQQQRCFQALVASGRIRRSPFSDVFELVR